MIKKDFANGLLKARKLKQRKKVAPVAPVKQPVKQKGLLYKPPEEM